MAVVNRSTQNVTRMRSCALIVVAITAGCACAPGVAVPDRNVRGARPAEASNLDEASDYDPWQPFNDLYSPARNGYLQHHRATILRAAADRQEQWPWAFERPEPTKTTVAVVAAEPEAPIAVASAEPKADLQAAPS